MRQQQTERDGRERDIAANFLPRSIRTVLAFEMGVPMMGIAVAAALAAQSPCNPIADLESLLERDARFVAIGEVHGTSEAPAAFADLVCHALQRQPVTVALEYPVQMQPVLDAFMSETSAEKARADLLSYGAGPFRFHDGRGSEAMLGLLESLRAMRQAGGDLNVAATVPDSPRVAGFTQAHSELDRAHLWSVLARTAPERRVLIFVGSIHAEKARRVGSSIGLPAAAHLRPEETVSLFIAQQGGEAWNCRAECGVNPVPAAEPTDQRGVYPIPRPTDRSMDIWRSAPQQPHRLQRPTSRPRRRFAPAADIGIAPGSGRSWVGL